MTISTIITDLIDRKTASRLLKTSIRTIDRYRQYGRLSTTIVGNKIYLKKEEIKSFIERLERQSRQQEKTYVSTEDSVDRRTEAHDKREDKTKDEAEPIRSHHEHDVQMEEYYKKMIEELIAQLRTSVPLVEFQKEKKQFLLESSQYKKIAQQKDAALKKIQKDFFLERLNKRVYLFIALGLILLQPILLLLIK